MNCSASLSSGRYRIEWLLKIFLWLVMATCWQARAQSYDTNNPVVQTFVGSGFYGFYDGQGQQTMFYNPSQIVADSSGNLYVLDNGNGRIRQVTAGGMVSTYAGGGTEQLSASGTLGENAALNYTFGSMAIDSSTNLWITTSSGLLEIKPYYLSYGGNNETFTNVGAYCFAPFQLIASGSITAGSGVCVDSSNNVYWTTGSRNQIYRYTPGSAVSSLAFAGSGNPGHADGYWIFTSFNNPTALAADPAGNIYLWDSGNHLIRRIDQNTNVVTLAGSISPTQDRDGIGTNAWFQHNVGGMCFDGSGNLILGCVTCARRMAPNLTMSTIAGNFTTTGYLDTFGQSALFSGASGVCFSQGQLFVVDTSNQRVRSISFNVSTQVVPGANLALNMYPGLQITGIVGRTYQIQSSPDMSTWTTRTTLVLGVSPSVWIDQNPVSGSKFYRALLLP